MATMAEMQAAIAKVEDEIAKVEDEIAKVETEIAEVATLVVEAGEKFRSAAEAGDHSTANYWEVEKARLGNKEERLGNKEAQLRDEEAQLRDEEAHLRKDKAQLRVKERLLLEANVKSNAEAASGSGARGTSGLIERIRGTCNAFADLVRVELEGLSRDPSQFRKQFPSSKTQVCCIDGVNPCLLWEGLAEGDSVGGEHVKSLQPRCLTVLLAPSGAGKTRTLIELGSQANCLYFVGKAGFSLQEGSRDLEVLRDHLSSMFPDPEVLIPMDALQCCIAALVMSRLFILALLRTQCPDMKHRDWTYFQLEHVARNRDVFQGLTGTLLSAHVKSTSNFRELVEVFKTLITEHQWGGVVMVDEAQQIDKWLVGRFKAEGSEQRRSLMNSFLFGLTSMNIGTSFFMAGTGECMLTVSKTASVAGSLKVFRVNTTYRLKGFDTLEDMAKYLDMFVTLSPSEIRAIFKLFKGRRRLIVTALERFMTIPNASANVILDFGYDVCMRPGSQLGLMRSFKDDVQKFLDKSNTRRMLRNLVLYGEVPLYVSNDQDTMELLNCSLGEFVDKDDNELKRDPGLIWSSPGAKETLGMIKISEPLVRWAFACNMTEAYNLQPLLDNQRSSSGIGIAYELCNCQSLLDYFRENAGKSLNQLTELFNYQGDSMYDEPCRILEPKVPCLVTTIRPDYGLAQWLHDVEAGCAATFLHMGNAKYFAGPDKVCIVTTDNTQRKVPCLIQDTTGEKFDFVEALKTVDVYTIYGRLISKDEELQGAIDTLQAWCKTGYVQLLVTTPWHDLQERVPQVVGRQKVPNGSVDPLVGVIDSSNIHVFSDKLCDYMTLLKEKKEIRPSTPSSICIGVKRDGGQCGFWAKQGKRFCGVHEKRK